MDLVALSHAGLIRSRTELRDEGRRVCEADAKAVSRARRDGRSSPKSAPSAAASDASAGPWRRGVVAMTIEERLTAAIASMVTVYDDEQWQQWAKLWLSERD